MASNQLTEQKPLFSPITGIGTISSGGQWRFTGDDWVQNNVPSVDTSTPKQNTIVENTQPNNPLLSIAETSGVYTSEPIRNANLAEQAKSIQDQSNISDEIARLTKEKELADLRQSLGMTSVPQAPNLTETYKSLRETEGIQSLEDEITSIRQQKLALQDELTKERRQLIGEGGITQGFLSGTLSEKARRLQDELDVLSRQESLVNDRLTTKLNYIDKIITLTDKDYQTASAEYDKEFSKNYQVQELYNAQANEQEKDALSRLTTIINLSKDSGIDWSSIDQSMRNEINKAEVQAGLIPGTIETFMRAKPKANLLATVNGQDESGNPITTFIYADESGNPGIVQTVRTGGVSATTEALEDSRLKAKIDQLPVGQRDMAYSAVQTFKNGSDIVNILNSRSPNGQYEINSGPISGLSMIAQSKIGATSNLENEFLASITVFTANFIKSISGVAVSDRERKMLQGALPSAYATREKNIANIKVLTEFLKNKYELQIGINFADYPNAIPQIGYSESLSNTPGFQPE